MNNITTTPIININQLETKEVVKLEKVKPEVKANSVLPAKAEVLTTQELKASKVKPINLVEKTVKAVTSEAVTGTTKKIFKSGAIGVPIDAVFNSFDYEKGKIDSKKYVAKTANGFVSWSFFESGSLAAVKVAEKVVGKKISPLGTMIIGTGLGVVSSALYNKTVGEKVENKLVKYIPEKLSKPIADSMAKYIAKPINKYIVNPIKEHPKTSIALGITAATALTIKYPKAFGVNFLTGAIGSTAIGISGSIALDKALSKTQPVIKTSTTETPKPVTRSEYEWAIATEKKFNLAPNSVPDKDAVKYYDILKRLEASKK